KRPRFRGSVTFSPVGCQDRSLPRSSNNDQVPRSFKPRVRPVKKYLIERQIPGVDQLTGEQLKGAAATSNAALAQLGPEKVQWVSSFVAKDTTFCVYLAEDEAA